MTSDSEAYAQGMEHLVEVVQQLSLAPDLDTVVDVVRKAARRLTGADGATFVLREGDLCHYVEEDAIGPLWRGKRFPITSCISGWAMLNAQPVALEDIYQDPRIPADAYRPTFVKSLVMVPIRTEQPIGAIGNYWASHHRAQPHEVKLLQSLAHSTAVALQNVQLLQSLKSSLDETRAARDELQRQLALRDEFIAMAAHELRTPVTPLTLQMHVLRKLVSSGAFRGHPQEDALVRYLDVSQRQLAGLGRLAEDMLDASRIRLGRLTVKPEEDVDLSELVLLAVAQVRANHVTPVEVSTEPGIRGAWDPVRLGQVVRNLVDNAAKFGAGHPVEVASTRTGEHAVITVRDHGPGIAPQDQERIFGRFERATDVTSYRGLGLGLYVARHIVEAHGGAITVESAPGQGACFTVRLPLGLG
ncbi:MAG: HAMP domain-containing sensor histidine kinase [Myxococcota bacterium]